MAEPFGDHGRETAPSPVDGCSCGAGPHPDHADRCAAGHVLPGNTTAAVVGHRGRRFWDDRAELVRELRQEVATDLGHTSYHDAPAAARAAIDGLLQAAVTRDAAHARVLAEGGPLSSSGRARRAATVALEWDRRCESWARLLGLQRVPKAPQSLSEYLASREEAAT